LLRASGSVGANYIEANDALGKKNFLMKVKISRREAKESRMFLRLLDLPDGSAIEHERDALVQEASEVVKIFSAMLRPRD
jgi:four helix bundle protein